MWNGTMFVDLDWPLNASSLLSASAELLVKRNFSACASFLPFAYFVCYFSVCRCFTKRILLYFITIIIIVIIIIIISHSITYIYCRYCGVSYITGSSVINETERETDQTHWGTDYSVLSGTHQSAHFRQRSEHIFVHGAICSKAGLKVLSAQWYF